ncbi:MAG TPA: DMT family transporter [Aggregatilineales bacterium]|nr:DMT family transporter [Aggregatilineales bacterium]
MAHSSQEARRRNTRGLTAALMSPIFLGMAPVLGKLALLGGSDPFTVAATRTVIAAAFLWVAYLLFGRRYIYIYPAGLLGCVVVGAVNGIGSLFYYNGLQFLSASVVQLLNATYLIFVVVLARMGGQRLTRRTVVRATLALIAVTLLTNGIAGNISWLGAGLIVGNAILFAGTIILSQRVLYEMPSQTVTLYVMTTMAVVVVMARVVYRLEWIPQSTEAIGAILTLGATTAVARLLLFAGVKQLGPLQTVLVGILETVVALVLSFIFLHDSLTSMQWVGVGILLTSLLLIRPNDLEKRDTGEMPVLNMAGMGFQHVAFTQAFSNGTVKLTEEELEMIRRMLEAKPRPGPSTPQTEVGDPPPA